MPQLPLHAHRLERGTGPLMARGLSQGSVFIGKDFLEGPKLGFWKNQSDCLEGGTRDAVPGRGYSGSSGWGDPDSRPGGPRGAGLPQTRERGLGQTVHHSPQERINLVDTLILNS